MAINLLYMIQHILFQVYFNLNQELRKSIHLFLEHNIKYFVHIQIRTNYPLCDLSNLVLKI